MDKHEIAKIFEEIALLYELKGENPFKVRAYLTAARAVESLEEDLGSIIQQGKLSEIPGLGTSLREKVQILYEKGSLPMYNKLKQEIPQGLREMLAIPGLGAKKIKSIYDTLGIDSAAALKQACQEGRIRDLKGFGIKTEEKILEGLEHQKQYGRRYLWWKASIAAGPIIQKLSERKDVLDVQVAGSLRRRLETIGDIDLLVSAKEAEPIMDWFVKQNWVASVTLKGPTKSSIRLREGMQVDLRVVRPEQFAFALHYFTGSKEHNIKIRHLAREKGYTLNEYGILPLDKKTKPLFPKKKVIKEKDLFEALGLQYIPPELREDLGEIEAAKERSLPSLIEWNEIQGVFHCHTTDSDGHHPLEEMVQAAKKLGWKYIGISDHSVSSYQANGLDEERLLSQVEKIRRLNQLKKYPIQIFSGIESDILNDGSLDFSDDVLKELDFVIVSIHRGFRQDAKTITKRLIKAIEHPLTTMVGHLTGRLLLKRDPYALNVQKVIDAAIANQKIIELNANPYRLDMDWRLWHSASEKGLLCSINPDAHHIDHLEFVLAGINAARKGWLTKKQVFNAWPLKEVKAYLKRS